VFDDDLREALLTLSETQQQLIFLVFFVDGHSVLSASRELGLASSTADRYFKHALAKLTKKLAGPDKEQEQQ
jgi:DNA-directed RNA polymerase specialized sigma24 family protein